MKRFLKKRWHSIPVGILTAVLVVCLLAGSVLAAYNFVTATLAVEVREAIAVGVGTWDNLEPYGSVDDVDITFGGTADLPTVSIVTKSDKYVGEGFVAGESIVIPVNIRNGSDGSLNLGASVTGDSGLCLEYIWQTNLGPSTSTGPEGQELYREFEASGAWEPLSGWSATIAGHGGESGSAIVGAKVLFIRISVPGDAIPDTYTLTVALNRS